jgi:hypothetical protein
MWNIGFRRRVHNAGAQTDQSQLTPGVRTSERDALRNKRLARLEHLLLPLRRYRGLEPRAISISLLVGGRRLLRDALLVCFPHLRSRMRCYNQHRR